MIFQDQDINSIIEPEKVSFWPLQPGWYFLIGLVLILLAYIGWKQYRIWLQNAYKREAIKSINALSNEADFFYHLNSLIKSVAIQSYGRKNVADLSGKEWTAFLSKPENGIAFDSTVLHCLEDRQYHKSAEPIEDSIVRHLKSDSIHWIKKHK